MYFIELFLPFLQNTALFDLFQIFVVTVAVFGVICLFKKIVFAL